MHGIKGVTFLYINPRKIYSFLASFNTHPMEWNYSRTHLKISSNQDHNLETLTANPKSKTLEKRWMLVKLASNLLPTNTKP